MLGFLSKLDGWHRALLALLALYLALWPVEPLSPFVYSLRVVLQTLLYLLAGGLLVRLTVRVLTALTRRFLWRVRHRMAVAYFFVGVVPLSLAILLATFAILLAVGPVAAYLVTAELEERAAELYATVDSLAWEMRAAPRDQRGAIGLRFLDDMRARHSGILARLETPEGPVAAPPAFGEIDVPESLANYRGLVLWEGNLYLSAYAQDSEGAPSMLAMPPLTEEYLASLLPDLGVVELREQPAVGGRALQMAQTPLPGRGPVARAMQQAARSARPILARLPPPAHPFDWAMPWPAQTSVLVWDTGRIETRNLLALRTRPSAVFRHVLSKQSPQVTAVAKNLGLTLAILFGGALLVSTVVAVSLTRTVTGAINELYIGTRHVDRGDFSYRVPVRGRSQLTELARSFNAMTGSIERLIVDSKERERLESELQIAHEVQAQLFPRSTPRMQTIEALGVCKPAQSVSGDFYDYVRLGENRLALSFGDVSGKGISAALVMAAVHSTVRTQLALLSPAAGGDLGAAAARVVAEANRQLCAGTAPEKFATLFFGIYDEPSRRLHYCNAGHLPPIVYRDGKTSRLDVNGMVVGAFSHAEYQGASIDFLAGDLLCAFTDGISEPENPYGEEFGEERLSALIAREADRPVQEIIRIVLEEVAHWSAGAAAAVQDDQTVLLARGL